MRQADGNRMEMERRQIEQSGKGNAPSRCDVNGNEEAQKRIDMEWNGDKRKRIGKEKKRVAWKGYGNAQIWKSAESRRSEVPRDG